MFEPGEKRVQAIRDSRGDSKWRPEPLREVNVSRSAAHTASRVGVLQLPGDWRSEYDFDYTANRSARDVSSG